MRSWKGRWCLISPLVGVAKWYFKANNILFIYYCSWRGSTFICGGRLFLYREKGLLLDEPFIYVKPKAPTFLRKVRAKQKFKPGHASLPNNFTVSAYYSRGKIKIPELSPGGTLGRFLPGKPPLFFGCHNQISSREMLLNKLIQKLDLIRMISFISWENMEEWPS